MRKWWYLVGLLGGLTCSVAFAQTAAETPAQPETETIAFSQPAEVVKAFIDGFMNNDVDKIMKTVHEDAVGVEATGTVWKLERERVAQKLAQFRDLRMQFGVDKLKTLDIGITAMGPAMALAKVRMSVRAADDSEVAQVTIYALCVRNYEGWRVLVVGSDQ